MSKAVKIEFAPGFEGRLGGVAAPCSVRGSEPLTQSLALVRPQPPPSTLTVAEAEPSQHKGQHGERLGIHGTDG